MHGMTTAVGSRPGAAAAGGLVERLAAIHSGGPRCAWAETPRVKRGCFVPSDDARGIDEWGPSYFEHLLQHPELVLIWEPETRTFHVGCTRHAAARECLSSGQVAVDFACPFELPACPLQPLRGARLQRSVG